MRKCFFGLSRKRNYESMIKSNIALFYVAISLSLFLSVSLSLSVCAATQTCGISVAHLSKRALGLDGYVPYILLCV